MISTEASCDSILTDAICERRDLFPQNKRFDRALAMIFRRPIFDTCVQNHRAGPCGFCGNGTANFSPTLRAKCRVLSIPFVFENRRRPRHSRAGEQRRVKLRAALRSRMPHLSMRKSPTRACRIAATATPQCDCVSRFFPISFISLAERARSRMRHRSRGSSPALEC